MNEVSRMSATQEIQTQMTPLWDRLRERPTKNHHTSIDKAIDAHRDQVHERKHRINKEFGDNSNVMNRMAGLVQASSGSAEEKTLLPSDSQSMVNAADTNELEKNQSGFEYKEDLVEDFRRSTTKPPQSPADVPKGTYIDLEA